MSAQSVIIRVVGADGQPVSDTSLAVVESSVPFPEVALLADTNGEVSLRLPLSAEFTVRALVNDGRSGELRIITYDVENDRGQPRKLDISVT